ncbi:MULTISPECIES: hypothetical protein [unclassified Streptomyces]|nr:hypothetical protein OG457_47025 [Streptomyces sp. NBC_01207]WTA16764.1 hypothetical protein OG365_01065 [Streptomyces sp. NBC_00853]
MRLITARLPGAVTREMVAALDADAGEKQHQLNRSDKQPKPP